METAKGLMASRVVVNGKNRFAGGEGIVHLGIGEGRGVRSVHFREPPEYDRIDLQDGLHRMEESCRCRIIKIFVD